MPNDPTAPRLSTGAPRKCDCGACRACRNRKWWNAWWHALPYERQAEIMRARKPKRRRRKLTEYDLVRSRARNAVYRAIKRGALERGPCEIGEDCRGRVEAHHDDYSRPLEVRWICKKHHEDVHRPEFNEEEARNGSD